MSIENRQTYKSKKGKNYDRKKKYIRTCITIDNGKRYGKTKKRIIKQRINWGTHTEIMDPLMLLKITTIREIQHQF